MRPVHGGEAPPVLQPYAINDYGTGMMGVYAVALALIPGNIDPLSLAGPEPNASARPEGIGAPPDRLQENKIGGAAGCRAAK